MQRRRRGLVSEDDDDVRSVTSGVGEKERTGRVRLVKKICLLLPVVILAFFGLIHILNYIFGYLPLIWDDPASSSLDWTFSGEPSPDIASHLLDITDDVRPVPCHSHNDYWRRVPLYDALRWGCTGVEADVWLFDNELYVGHSTSALTPKRTFRSMYIDPLVRLLDHKNTPTTISPPSTTKNGVFATSPQQSLILLVDFKNNGSEIYPVVSHHLSALRKKDYLTYFNGETIIKRPITVVATGNAPFNLISPNTTHRDIFFDAPLDRLATTTITPHPHTNGQGNVGTSPTSHFDSTNSLYASVNFRQAVGLVWWRGMSAAQVLTVRAQIRSAHERGLKARYWGTPTWPVGVRNGVWKTLVGEGVDFLNGDDLVGMARLDWGVRRHVGVWG
ncbi:PLC-like phosphodiesterase [Phaeosphaeriaceae sp. PMI808]|nr:PLC-like phosphodiesterase [Phaeosphaeriaceae sp. PMI808]